MTNLANRFFTDLGLSRGRTRGGGSRIRLVVQMRGGQNMGIRSLFYGSMGFVGFTSLMFFSVACRGCCFLSATEMTHWHAIVMKSGFVLLVLLVFQQI